MNRFSVALLAVVAALPVFAQQPPPAARGFDPNKVFAAGPIDSINEFNGNVIATIPLGETFTVSPTLSYSFKAIHNGKTWDYVKRHVPYELLCENGPCSTTLTIMEAIPDGTANAGFGWRVQFARFIVPGDLQANIDRPLLETPDGAQHGLYVSLHDGDAQDGASYTRDASYLRWRETGLAGHTAVDTAEGVTYEFTKDMITLKNQLTQMHDQVKDGSGNFVNHVDIQYGPLPNDPPWPCTYPTISQKVTDTKSRTSYVCFQNMNYDGTNVPIVTDVYVGTPAGTGHYAFNQVPTAFGRENADKDAPYLIFPPMATVAALMSITLPDGSSYDFQYFGTTTNPGIATGNLESITLPTKGSYGYDYGYYQIPTSYDCTTAEEWSANSYSPGVTKREQRDANGTVVGKTNYGMYALNGGIDGGSYQCTTEQEGQGYFNAFAPGAELKTVVIPGDNHSRTFHYYSVWPGYNRLMVDSPDGFKRMEYGLPFTRNASKMRDGLFLSTETYLCTDALNEQCSPTPIRATYVQYEVDAYVDHTDITTLEHNPRVKKAETVYFDDIDPDTDAPKTTISTVSNDNFDGLGHYRVSETAGFGAASKRQTTTYFNPNAGTFPGTHTLPLVTSPWLLNLFTYQETKEINTSGSVLSSAKTEVCFDSNTGFLKRRRTIAGGTTDPTYDLLAVFEPNGNGEVANESYYGGDRSPLPPGFDTCSALISGPQYRMTHDYASGVMTRSQYDGTTFNSFDVDVYPSTSAISTSRDTAGIPTTYVYDALGRITEIRPQGTAWTGYEYHIPTTASDVPFVAVRQRPEGTSTLTPAITEQRFYFDALGRLIQRKSAMPDNQWATVKRTYDFMGRISKEYVPYVATSADFDLSFTPLTYTEYTYDDLGRNTIVKAPDGKQTTTAYFAASQQRRTSGVATGVNQETSQTTRYIYDYLGRLTTVKEKSNTITAGYSYDIGDRLSLVQISGIEGSQSRSFSYDNRGFLTSEYHPENGTTTYPKYDARGHVWEKRTAGDSAFDLNMTFDSAERLKQIDSRNPYYPASQPEWRPSKLFFFGDANVTTADGSTSYVQGRMASSQRHNYQPLLGDILLTEAFEYNNAGRVSKKTTTAAEHQANSDATIQSFEQKFTYDALGNTLKAGYSNCLTAWCGGSPLAEFEYTYEKGYLKSVPGFIDSISYYPTGLMEQLNHSSGVTTHQTQDNSGMARVKNITVSNYGNCAVPVPVITSGPADTPVNNESTASLTVYATGSSLTYQWYKATTGQAIAGATASTYTTPPMTQTTSYYVIIMTPCGSTQSRTVVVTVCTQPAIDIQPGDTTASANGTATLTVHANGGPLLYQWYNATTGQPIAGATSSSYTTPVLTQTMLYYVVVSTPCGSSATSHVATVTLCTTPSLSPQPSNTVVVFGSTTTLIANATGASLHYHWYAGFTPDVSNSVGTDSPSYTTAAVTSTSHYWVQVANSCGSVNGSTLTVTPVSAPASVIATYNDATHVQVQWPAAANAVQYRIMRRESGLALRPVMTVASSVLTTLDTVPNNLEFLYCVQALDTAGAATPCSVAEFASTRTFTAITTGQRIFALDFQQILDGVNAVYDISGAAHVTWSSILPQGVPAPAPNVWISYQHVTSLRAAVAAARAQVAQSSAVSIPGIAFTDPLLGSGMPIKAIHVQELQGGLR